MASEPSCAISSWEFLGSLSDRWLPTNGFAVWCVGLSVISSSSHARADTHIYRNVTVLHLPTRFGREAVCVVCASLTTPFTAGLCLKLTTILSRDVCVNALRGENWTVGVSLPVTWLQQVRTAEKSNFCCLPELMELCRTSVLTKDVHQWFCGYYYHVSSRVYSTFLFCLLIFWRRNYFFNFTTSCI